ncbi:MAG: hypothetical protein R3183_06865 [Oleiphilaceae bacterium]|nr:hypothetical protein [Oleiphilaceae bacterium]
MSFWAKSTGETVNKSNANANYEQKSGGEPIPDMTVCKAIITESKWDTYNGERYISNRWDVIDGDYKKRVVFQKVKVCNEKESTRDNAIDMLAAIDMNATGGKLMSLGREPSDMDLMTTLTNKPMHIRVRLWEIDKDMNGNPLAEPKRGNWIDAVSGAASSGKNAPQAPKAPATPEPSAAQQAAADQGFDDDLGF